MNSVDASFTSDIKLRLLIEQEPKLLNVMSRFGLSFGFGEKTVEQVCSDDDVHPDTFLAVCNLVCNRPYFFYKISLPSIIGYLRKAHEHFLDFLLPSIRRKLIDAISGAEANDVALLLLKFYDEYVASVRRHMNHENDVVFPYVQCLLRNEVDPNFRITDYALNHESMTRKLNDIKDIFIRQFRVRDNRMLTSALLDIIDCGNELDLHSRIENDIFTPAVKALEEELKINASAGSNIQNEQDENIQNLSDREKEIIACVARGMSNKDIADALFLSVHTVTTHRRNIISKLHIHSAAGLTIFAILNNLIDIRDVNLYS